MSNSKSWYTLAVDRVKKLDLEYFHNLLIPILASVDDEHYQWVATANVEAIIDWLCGSNRLKEFKRRY